MHHFDFDVQDLIAGGGVIMVTIKAPKVDQEISIRKITNIQYTLFLLKYIKPPMNHTYSIFFIKNHQGHNLHLEFETAMIFGGINLHFDILFKEKQARFDDNSTFFYNN